MSLRSAGRQETGMSCERYQEWIKLAALNSLDPSRQAALSTHLAECAACRESLESQRRLVELIDMGLSASVAEVPSADFAARMRIRLAAEGERARSQPARVRTGWIAAPMAAVLALATLFAMIWPALRHPTQPQARRQTARASAPSASSPVAGLPAVATEDAGARLASDAGREPQPRGAPTPEHARTRRRARHEDQGPQLQVLVEPGQWREIVEAYRLAQSGHVDTPELTQGSDQEEQPEDMKPIEIKPVVIAELYPEKSSSPGGR